MDQATLPGRIEPDIMVRFVHLPFGPGAGEVPTSITAPGRGAEEEAPCRSQTILMSA